MNPIEIDLVLHKVLTTSVGWCEANGCGERATHEYDVWLNGIHMKTWVCLTHAKELSDA